MNKSILRNGDQRNFTPRISVTHLRSWSFNTGCPSMLFTDFVLQSGLDGWTRLDWGEGSTGVWCGGGESESGVTFGGGGGGVTP